MTWHELGPHRVWEGDNLDALRAMPDNSADAVVTDPPYGLAFMGRRWDYDVPSEELWREALRVAKPGAHLLSFGGSRTFHRIAVRVEDSGWDLRDAIMWLYGSGFPKSLDVSKAIDKAAGAEREVILTRRSRGGRTTSPNPMDRESGVVSKTDDITAPAPATEAAKAWEGWGTALKPAHEPIIVARKPLDGTVAANVERWGVGGVNVDGCRVATFGDRANESGGGGGAGYDAHNKPGRKYGKGLGGVVAEPHASGRWPANVIHDGSDEVQLAFAAFGESRSTVGGPRRSQKPGNGYGMTATGAEYADTGTAARFFYCAKASPSERAGSKHPTVKPLALMRYLVRLVTPPGGVVLDPFLGSGTTLLACEAEGFRCVGMEREHVEDVRLRWNAYTGDAS